MGRDYLGDNLPPDEINLIEEGKHYGWPVCFGNRVYDRKFGQKTPEFCQKTEPPVFELAAHVAPLGLVFVDSPLFPASWEGDLLVALHGSWNRTTPVGYKVVRIKMKEGKPTEMEDFITGWLKGGEVLGRPVDLTFDQQGRLYLSDDKAGVVYIIVGTPK